MNKKIAFITEEFTDGDFSSGGLKLDFMLLSNLIKFGYEIHVFARQYHKQISTKGLVTFDIKEFNEENDFSFVLVSKACNKGDITYLHDHTNIFRFNHLYGPVTKCLNRIFNTKQLEKRHQADNSIKENLKKINKIIVSSKILAKDYAENFGISEDRFIILPPPIVEQQTLSNIEKPTGDFIFGLSAIGFERKGGYITLNAISKLKKKYKNFKVIIIYPKVNFLIKSIIFLKGLNKHVEFIPCQKDMNDFYKKINVLIMPSKVEPFGMVASEAMSFGKPVIVSDISGAVDLITHDKNGLIISSNKHFATNLCHAMQQMLEKSESEYKEMCNNAFLSVKGLDISIFTEKYIELMESIKKTLDFKKCS